MLKWFRRSKKQMKQPSESCESEVKECVIFPRDFRLANTTKIQHYLDLRYNERTQRYESDMNRLRTLYLQDRATFEALLLEIYLRGGQFQLKESNANVFPPITYTKQPLCHLPQCDEAFRHINYQLLNIKQRMDTLNIQNNAFYYGIYIDGFKYLKLTERELAILYDELYRAGFYNDEMLACAKQEAAQNAMMEEEKEVAKEAVDLSHLSLSEQAMAIKQATDGNRYMVHQWVEQLPTSLNVMKRFLYAKYADISVAQLTVDDWEKVLSCRGAGKKKQMEFVSYVTADQPIVIDKTTEEINVFNIKHLVQHYPFIQTIPIQALWDQIPDNQQKIKMNLQPLTQKTFGQVNEEEWNDHIFVKGVGESKLSVLRSTIKQWLSQEEEDQQAVLKGLSEYTHTSLFTQLWDISAHDINERDVLLSCMERTSVVLPDIDLQTIVDAFQLKINDAFIEEFIVYATCSLAEIKEQALQHQPMHIQIIQLWLVFVGLCQQLYHEVSNNLLFCDLDLTQKEWGVMHRRYHHETLADIGEQFEVTRERVRQVEKKAMNKVKASLIDHHLTDVVDVLIGHDGLLNIDDETSLLAYLPYFMSEHYVKIGDYITTSEMIQTFDELRDALQQQLETQLVLTKTDVDKLSRQNGIHWDEDDFRWNVIFNYCDIQMKQTSIFSKKLSLAEQCALIVKLYFEKGIYLSDEAQLQAFMHHYDELFAPHTFFTWDEPLTEVARRIDGNMDRSSLVKTERRTYAFDNVQLPEPLIHQVKQYIDEELTQLPVVYQRKLNAVFHDELALYDAKEFTLYQTIKKHYPHDYIYSSGRTMRLFSKQMGELTTEEIFTTIIKQQGGAVDIGWIQEALSIESYTIEQIISQKDNDIQRCGQQIVLQHHTLAEELHQCLAYYIDKQLENYGAVAPQLIFATLSLEQADIVQRYNITKESITDYLKQVNPALKGRQQLLTLTRENHAVYRFMRRYLGEKTVYSVQEMKALQVAMGYSETTISMNAKEASKQLVICRIDDDSIVYANHIVISQQQKQELQEIIAEWMVDKQWIAVASLSRRKLMKLAQQLNIQFEFPFTSDVLRFILQNDLGFNVLSAKGITMTIDPYIMTKNETLTFKDIVIDALNHYDGEWTSQSMTDYLVQQTIIKQPKELRLPDYICELASLSVDALTNEVTYHE